MNTIFLNGNYQLEEKLAGASGIMPGMLVKTNSSDAVVVHATAGGYAERMFVAEDSLQGKTVDDVYTSGQPVRLLIMAPGSQVQALLEPGHSYAIGDKLQSNGAGSLEPISSTNVVLAVVAETADLSDSDATNNLVAVRVI
jgi:hypothetical protein